MPNRPLSFGFRRLWWRIAWVALVAVPAAAAETPTLRLPQTVKPIRYALEATLDPSADSYSGRVEIDVTVTAGTDTVWLHAVNLEISGATVGGSPAENAQKGEFLGLKPQKPLVAGPTQIRLDFKTKLLEGTQAGFFRVRDGK